MSWAKVAAGAPKPRPPAGEGAPGAPAPEKGTEKSAKDMTESATEKLKNIIENVFEKIQGKDLIHRDDLGYMIEELEGSFNRLTDSLIWKVRETNDRKKSILLKSQIKKIEEMLKEQNTPPPQYCEKVLEEELIDQITNGYQYHVKKGDLQNIELRNLSDIKVIAALQQCVMKDLESPGEPVQSAGKGRTYKDQVLKKWSSELRIARYCVPMTNVVRRYQAIMYLIQQDYNKIPLEYIQEEDEVSWATWVSINYPNGYDV
jgi:hypothetical protein